jgi:hypothetical protein
MSSAQGWRRNVPKALFDRSGRRARATQKLSLEVLEDRTLPSTWTALGPAAINNGWQTQAASGRIVALAADPTNASIIYIAAAGGGVWKTTNGGTSWTPLTDTQSTLFMGSIAVAAGTDVNHRIIYAGTGEANFSGHDTFYGRGVLVSKDSGATWTLTGNSVFNRLAIGKVVIDPTDSTGNTAYAAVSGEPNNGIGDGAGGNWGIWKTTNGGTTWTNTTSAVVPPTASELNPFTDLIIDPNNHNILYAAVGEPGGFSSFNGVYKTTNGGSSWTASAFPGQGTSGLGRITLAVAKNSTTLYASVSDPSQTSTKGFGATLEIEKSTNSGSTWSAVMTEASSNYINYMGGQGWYDQTLICDPADATGNTVYAAGQADPTLYPLDSVIKTTNGGTAWSDITQGTNGNQPHVDHHGIGFDANGKLLDGNDGGIWRLDNATVGSIQWTDLNGNLSITEFTGTALDPTTASVAYGGSQDNGTEKYTGSTAWNLVLGGDGGFVRVDPNTPTTVYTENFGVSLQRSTNGGTSWTPVSSGILGNAPADNNPAGEQSFYIPYVLDPTNTSRIVLGTTDINQSLNQGTNWTQIATPGLNGYNPGNDAFGTTAGVTALATRGNTVYAATSDGRVWVTTNDGVSWAERDPMPVSNFVGGAFTPGGYQDLEIDQADTTGNTAYIVTAEFQGDLSGTSASPHHVFKTTNGGATWTDISSGLPDLPTWSIAIDHANNTLYVGNDNGVYVSTNGGSTWSAMGAGMPNVQVNSLQYSASLNVLLAGTHGRGAWEISTLQPPTVTGISPNSGPLAGGNSVTIAGTNFTPTSTVKFGTTVASSVTFVSGTSLTATAPAESAGTVDITVTTALGTSPTSAADQYTYVGVPTVTSIWPTSGPSSGGTAVTITGTNFTPGSTVMFGTVAASGVIYVSPTDLAAVSPPGTIDSTVDVTVIAAGGTSATSAADKYTFVGPFAKYVVAIQGSSTVQAGSNFVVSVQATDAGGNPVVPYGGPSTVTASVSPASAASNFPLTVQLNNYGIGYFQGNLQKVGSYTISASNGAFTSNAAPVTVIPGPSAHLVFGTEPVNIPTGVVLPTVTAQVQDAFGNLETGDNSDAITVSVGSGPGSFLVGSTTNVTTVNGVASFANLTLVVPGSYTLNAVIPAFINAVSTPFSVAPLQVVPASFVGAPWGFSLQMNAPYLVNSVTPVLYGTGFQTTAPPPSVIVTTDPAHLNNFAAYVLGSLVLNTATNRMTFVVTDTTSLVNTGAPQLPDGTYTVIVRASAANNGFQALNSGGGFLDGLGSGVPGSGDYTTTFTVNVKASNQDVVWIPPTADGPGQPLEAPGNNRADGGYPVYLNASATNITSVLVTLNYNPTLLTVTGVTGAGFTLLGTSTPGQANLQYSGPALAAGTATPIGFVTATLPSGTTASPMPYKAKDLMHLSGIALSGPGGAIAAASVDAVHLVAYVGDADGNGSYSSNDAVLITRTTLQADNGFTAYSLVDPVVVADLDGSGFLPADAGLQVNEAGVGLPAPSLPSPPIPSGVHSLPIANNVDPSLTIPTGLHVAGGVLTVPVNIDDPHPEGSTGLIEAHLALTYDPHAFTLSAADIHLGSVLSAAGGWNLVPTINPVTGEIAIALSSTTPVHRSAGGSLVTIDFHAITGEPGALATGAAANPVANAPGSSIALVASVNPTGQQVVFTELEDAQGTFTLTPAPTNPILVGPAPSIGVPSGLSGPTETVAAATTSALSLPILSVPADVMMAEPGHKSVVPLLTEGSDHDSQLTPQRAITIALMDFSAVAQSGALRAAAGFLVAPAAATLVVAPLAGLSFPVGNLAVTGVAAFPGLLVFSPPYPLETAVGDDSTLEWQPFFDPAPLAGNTARPNRPPPAPMSGFTIGVDQPTLDQYFARTLDEASQDLEMD